MDSVVISIQRSPLTFIGYSMVEMLRMAINKYRMAIEPYTIMFM